MSDPGYVSKKLLAARFGTITGPASSIPFSTSSSLSSPIDPSMNLAFVASDFLTLREGAKVLFEVSLSLSNLWHQGPPGSGPEFEILFNQQAQVRGRSTAAVSGQYIPIVVQGWVINVHVPTPDAPLIIQPNWRVNGTGTSFLESRGYGAAFIRAAAFELEEAVGVRLDEALKVDGRKQHAG